MESVPSTLNPPCLSLHGAWRQIEGAPGHTRLGHTATLLAISSLEVLARRRHLHRRAGVAAAVRRGALVVRRSGPIQHGCSRRVFHREVKHFSVRQIRSTEDEHHEPDTTRVRKRARPDTKVEISRRVLGGRIFPGIEIDGFAVAPHAQRHVQRARTRVCDRGVDGDGRDARRRAAGIRGAAGCTEKAQERRGESPRRPRTSRGP